MLARGIDRELGTAGNLTVRVPMVGRVLEVGVMAGLMLADAVRMVLDPEVENLVSIEAFAITEKAKAVQESDKAVIAAAPRLKEPLKAAVLLKPEAVHPVAEAAADGGR